MRDLYMKNGQGFVLVYSITNSGSFTDLDDIHQQIVSIKDTEDVPMIIVGNNCECDDQRVITTQQGEELAARYSGSTGCCIFLEVSTRMCIRVNDVFTKLVQLIDQKSKPAHKKSDKCIIF